MADVRLPLAAALLCLGACHKESEGQAIIKQERDIAYVESLQHRPPPLVTVRALPVDIVDVRKHNLAQPPCTFGMPASGIGQPLAYLGAERALMNLDGDFQTFAADNGGPSLSRQVFAHYASKSFSFTLVPMDSAKGIAGPTILTLRDPYDRTVYSVTASLVCSDGPRAD